MKKRVLSGLLGALLLLSLIVPSALALNLQYGSSGDQVAQVQTRLKELGFYKGAVDAKYGHSTVTAVRQFQTKNGLTSDGVVGENTYTLMFSSMAIAATGGTSPAPLYQRIAYGSQGPAVMTVQGMLRDLGYYTKDVEGKFGYSTFQAVKKYQTDNGLTADGVVGPATWAALTGGVVPPMPPPPPPGDPADLLPYKYDDKGPGVLLIQQMLDALDYNVGEVDNRYGYLTYRAVRAFQKNNGLKVDGVVGKKTWDILFGPTPVPATSPAPADPDDDDKLQLGDSGDKVGHAQQKLADLGYLKPSDVDKKFGYKTYLAVRAFQKLNGLKVDGVIGEDTRFKLFGMSPVPADAGGPETESSLPLRYKSKGTLVKELQTMLVGLGYLKAGDIDSYFGYGTYQAVRAFQKVNKLKVDGAVGVKTWELLKSGTALPKPPTP